MGICLLVYRKTIPAIRIAVQMVEKVIQKMLTPSMRNPVGGPPSARERSCLSMLSDRSGLLCKHNMAKDVATGGQL